MKKNIFYSLLFVGLASAWTSSCSKEVALTPTEDTGFEQQFQPGADAHPIEKKLYQEYNVWARMEFKDYREVYNSYLGQDVNNARFPVEKVDADQRESAYVYLQTLLSNVSTTYAQQLMPNEIFFVKNYGHPLWGYQFVAVGRNRLAFVWPNETYGAIQVTDPENHYYMDEALTKEVWRNLAEMIGTRMTEEIPDFEKIGKPYDGGAAFTKIRDQYFIDYDLEKRNRDWQTLADQGGYLDAYSSFSFKAEYSAFLKLILLESYENINANYLAGNPMRKQKYDVFVKYFKDTYNWDIQAAGNKYREKLNSFKK